MSLSSLNTGCFSSLRSKGEHTARTGTRSFTSGCLCHLVSLPRSCRQPLFHLGKEVFAFSTTSMTGSYWPSLEGSYVNTGTQCSGTSASWGFGSTGKITNSPLCRESLFSVCSWTRQPHSTSLNRTCSVDAELPGVFQAQEGGSTETVSEAPGAYVQGQDCSGTSTALSCSMACSASLQIAAIQQARAGPYGQHCEGCGHEPSRRSTLLSHVTTRPPSPQKHLRSLRAVHVPDELNHAADELSHLPPLLGEWELHPETVQLIWKHFGDAQVDLFASPDTSHCQLFYSQSEGTLGTAGPQLASGPTQVCVSPSEPSRTDTV